jgi:uncharacterized membrane protein
VGGQRGGGVVRRVGGVAAGRRLNTFPFSFGGVPVPLIVPLLVVGLCAGGIYFGGIVVADILAKRREQSMPTELTPEEFYRRVKAGRDVLVALRVQKQLSRVADRLCRDLEELDERQRARD